MPTTPKRSSARCLPRAIRRWIRPKTPDSSSTTPAASAIRPSRRSSTACRTSSARAGKGKIFGVLGCVAQQEGEKIFERAPHVSLVAGSASYTRLGEMLVQLEAGNRRVTGLSLDTDETFDTPFTRRDNPHRAYITIIEGCDKSCAYCVVPFTRGPERSRTSESVMAEARRLAEQGYTEIQLLGQNVNSYRDPSPAGWDFATLLARVAEIPGIRRVRYTTSHPARFRARHRRRHGRQPRHLRSRPSARAVRILPRARRHGPPLHPRRVHAPHRVDQERQARATRITTDIIVGFPGETEDGFRADARPARRSAVRFALQLQILAAAQHRRARHGKTRSPKRKSSAAS